MTRERDRLGVAPDGDGASELSPAEAAATRDLLAALRDLPRPGVAPDWAALERSISEAVGPGPAPRAWWQRFTWRWAAPVLAGAVAVIALLAWPHAREVAAPPTTTTTTMRPSPTAVAPDPAPHDTVALWLDGRYEELASDAGELLAEPELELDALPADELRSPPADLAWLDDIDELDGEQLERAAALLDAERG